MKRSCIKKLSTIKFNLFNYIYTASFVFLLEFYFLREHIYNRGGLFKQKLIILNI